MRHLAHRRKRNFAAPFAHQSQRVFFGVLRLAPKLGERWAVWGVFVAPQEIADFKLQNAERDAVIPANARANRAVVMEEARQAFGAKLYHAFDEFHPQQHPPGRHVARGENLVFVVPFALVELNDLAVFGLAEKGRPAMRRDIHHLNLVGIIMEKLFEAVPVVAVGFFLETYNPRRHRQNIVRSQQANRFAVFEGVPPLRILSSVASS